MIRYLVVLLALPFVDLFLLMEIASSIGFWKTLGLVLLTGLVGAEMVRREIGFVLEKMQTSVTAEEVSRNFVETFLLLAAGLMLVSPGVITDLLGVSLAFRPFRERLLVYLSGKLEEKMDFRVEKVSF